MNISSFLIFKGHDSSDTFRNRRSLKRVGTNMKTMIIVIAIISTAYAEIDYETLYPLEATMVHSFMEGSNSSL